MRIIFKRSQAKERQKEMKIMAPGIDPKLDDRLTSVKRFLAKLNRHTRFVVRPKRKRDGSLGLTPPCVGFGSL